MRLVTVWAADEEKDLIHEGRCSSRLHNPPSAKRSRTDAAWKEKPEQNQHCQRTKSPPSQISSLEQPHVKSLKVPVVHIPEAVQKSPCLLGVDYSSPGLNLGRVFVGWFHSGTNQSSVLIHFWVKVMISMRFQAVIHVSLLCGANSGSICLTKSLMKRSWSACQHSHLHHTPMLCDRWRTVERKNGSLHHHRGPFSQHQAEASLLAITASNFLKHDQQPEIKTEIMMQQRQTLKERFSPRTVSALTSVFCLFKFSAPKY